MVSLSLKVTECGSLRLSKSTVMPNGIATSSVLAFAYRARAVVHAVGDVVHREGLADRLDQGGEVRVVGEGQQGALEGGDDRRQGEVCPLLITFPDLKTR